MMKKVLLITLSAMTVSATAQVKLKDLDPDQLQALVQEKLKDGGEDRRAAKAKQLAEDDVALKQMILRQACSGHDPSPTMQDIAGVFEIPHERMAKMLEEIVRERLSYMEKAEGTARITPRNQLCATFLQLKHFQSPQTLGLLRECTDVSTDDRLRRAAAQAYIEIANGEGDTVDFLREVIEGGRLSSLSRHEVYKFLSGEGYKKNFLAELKGKNKHDKVESLQAFLLDRILAEQEWYCVWHLDDALSANLDGYAQSVQREQAIQKFVSSEDPEIRNRSSAIKTELNAVQTDKRKDFRVKGELLDPERKKE